MEELRICHESLRLGVDSMILEYLVDNATRTLLGPESLQEDLQDHLLMVDSFLDIFKSKHAKVATQRLLSFRVQLLQFTAVYVRRFDEPSSLPKLSIDENLLPDPSLETYYEVICSPSFREMLEYQDSLSGIEMLKQYGIHHLTARGDCTRLYAETPHACQSLLDLIYPFVSLTASREAIDGIDINNWDVTPTWFNFAAEMLVQACLEQWLVLDKRSPQVLVEAFTAAYGEAIDNNTCDLAVRGLFESTVWHTMITSYLDDITHELPRALLLKYPALEFHGKMLSFLTALLDSLPVPELRQLEEGRLDGIPEEDTRILLERVGLK